MGTLSPSCSEERQLVQRFSDVGGICRGVVGCSALDLVSEKISSSEGQLVVMVSVK